LKNKPAILFFNHKFVSQTKKCLCAKKRFRMEFCMEDSYG